MADWSKLRPFAAISKQDRSPEAEHQQTPTKAAIPNEPRPFAAIPQQQDKTAEAGQSKENHVLRPLRMPGWEDGGVVPQQRFQMGWLEKMKAIEERRQIQQQQTRELQNERKPEDDRGRR